MTLNFLVAGLKLFGGLIFNFSSLLLDSLQSIADFTTDIIAGVAGHVGRKRANKRYPFGYGSIENIANLITALLLAGLGVFAVIHALQPDQVDLEPAVFVVIAVALALKLVVLGLLIRGAKRLHSDLLLTGAKESLMDVVSTVVVLVVAICLLFTGQVPALAVANTLGGLFISVLIFITAGQMLLENVRLLLGNNADDDDTAQIADQVKTIVNRHNLVKDCEVKLLQRGEYYSLYLGLRLARDLTLTQVFRLEKSLKRAIRDAEKLKIRFIEFELKPFHED